MTRLAICGQLIDRSHNALLAKNHFGWARVRPPGEC